VRSNSKESNASAECADGDREENEHTASGTIPDDCNIRLFAGTSDNAAGLRTHWD
jgi:hypothetical protein